MRYRIFSFRNAQTIFENDQQFSHLWEEVKDTLNSISDQDIIESYNDNNRKSKKSISDDINRLIDQRLVQLNWNRQSAIFNDSIYRPRPPYTVSLTCGSHMSG